MFTVSLQQMALFGQNPSQGTLLKGSQFLAGEYATPLCTAKKYVQGEFRGASCTLGAQGQGAR